MIIFFVGENPELLASLAQQITDLKVRTISDISTLLNEIQQVPSETKQLIIFDINYPMSQFGRAISLVKNKLPEVPCWAIFDSESLSLKAELSEMRFEKIVSYRDNLKEIILTHLWGA